MNDAAGLLIKAGLNDVAKAVNLLENKLVGRGGTYGHMGTLNECAWIIAGGIVVAGLLIGAAIVGREILAARRVTK